MKKQWNFTRIIKCFNIFFHNVIIITDSNFMPYAYSFVEESNYGYYWINQHFDCKNECQRDDSALLMKLTLFSRWLRSFYRDMVGNRVCVSVDVNKTDYRYSRRAQQKKFSLNDATCEKCQDFPSCSNYFVIVGILRVT